MADTETPKTPRMRLWLRGVLFASLALNLAVVGVVAGAIWRHGGDDDGRRGPRPDRVSMAYIRALDDADKRAIRTAMRAEMPDRSVLRAQLRDSFNPVIEALRRDSIDRDALGGLLDAQFEQGSAARQRARGLMIDRLAGMSVADRRAFADRLEQELERMDRRGDRPKKR